MTLREEFESSMKNAKGGISLLFEVRNNQYIEWLESELSKLRQSAVCGSTSPSELLAERDRYQFLYEDYSTELQETKMDFQKLEEQNDELVNSITQLQAELYAIHLQYGDKQNALESSAALRLSEQLLTKIKQ